MLQRAVDFHDPARGWSRARLTLQLQETRPDEAQPRLTELRFDNAPGTYEIRQHRPDGHETDLRIEGGRVVEARLDGSTGFSEEEADYHRLTPDRALWARDYYLYLYGLPMKLTDPGTRLDPQVTRTEYAGMQALELRVTYDPEVGSDIWYFYFDPGSYQMIGYRFYHDESAGDGEYILLEGLTDVSGFRLPESRTWFTNAGDRFSAPTPSSVRSEPWRGRESG